MSRKSLLDVSEQNSAKSQNLVPSSSLKSLVESYIVNKQKEAEYKKAASAENTEIKEIMTQNNIFDVATDLGIARLSEQNTTTFVEEKLIAFLKENNLNKGIVKTKEYVDYDALESALYHNEISDELKKQMASCQETKTTLVLRIKTKKGD